MYTYYQFSNYVSNFDANVYELLLWCGGNVWFLVEVTLTEEGWGFETERTAHGVCLLLSNDKRMKIN